MDVLLIANSFGVNLQKYAHQIAKMNGDVLNIYTLYIGGCSLETHSKNIISKSKNYELFINGVSDGKYVSINEILELKKWDFVSLQQASHLSGIFSSYDPYFKSLSSYIKEISNDIKIIFHQTWAYSNNNPYKYSEVKTWMPKFPFLNENEMYNGIINSLTMLMNNYKIDLIINSGDVIHRASQKFENLYDEQGFHLNPVGCYLIGLNFVKKVFGKNINKIFIPEEINERECKESVNFINNLL